jgi:hypothetical protein
LVGTEAPDAFVVSEEELCGGGRYAEYINFQQFLVLAAEGNDRIYVIGSPQGAVLRVSGGLGSDSIQIASGWVPEPLACNPLRGHSGNHLIFHISHAFLNLSLPACLIGLINHTTSSNVAKWDNILVDGLVAHVHDPASLIFVTPRKAHIWADSNVDNFPSSFQVSFQLTTPPTSIVSMVIDVASRGFGASAALAITPTPHFTFNATNWMIPQTFTVTGHSVGDSDNNYKTSVIFTSYSDDKRFRGKPLPMITVEVTDAMRAPIMYRPANGGVSTLILEGTASASSPWINNAQIIFGVNNIYKSGGGVAPSVTIKASPNDQLITIQPVTLSSSITSKVVSLTAVDDLLHNGARDTFVYFTADSIDPRYDMSVANAPPPLSVHIEDDDTPNIMVGHLFLHFTLGILLCTLCHRCWRMHMVQMSWNQRRTLVVDQQHIVWH